MPDPFVRIRDLRVEYMTAGDRVITAVDGVSLDVRRGQRIGIVGESGSGKSTLGLATIGLLEPPGRIAGGELWVNDIDVATANAAELRQIRGSAIGMVFQDALGSLNPVLTIGAQLKESLRQHERFSNADAVARAVAVLAEVAIPNPLARMRQYPHELSGGMRQRVMIAMALASNPKVLIADEPTTALDVTTQAGVIDLLVRLSDERDMAVLLITHDLGVVAGFAQDVLVMYGGAPMEYGAVDDVYSAGRHPYTQRLLAAVPRLDKPRVSRLATISGSIFDHATSASACPFEPRCFLGEGRSLCRTIKPPFDPERPAGGIACHFSAEVRPQEGKARREELENWTPPESLQSDVLRLADLKKTFRRRFARTSHGLRAVDHVTFSIARGEAVGLVGESGSGKSTVARLILGLTNADAGTATFEGRPVSLRGGRPRVQRRRMQMVFQDPLDSLNPMMRIDEIVAEPMLIQRTTRNPRRRAVDLLDLVGLNPDYAGRRPLALSGGQRQRVAIARALATDPAILVCDEAVSSLDVSIRAQILNLLLDLRQSLDLSYLFISHDLSVVRHICDRVIVMYAGHVVECASADDLFSTPRHPYTVALLSAVPVPDPAVERRRRRRLLVGDPPDLTKSLEGCPFAGRCWKAAEVCLTQPPPLTQEERLHWYACHFPEGADSKGDTGEGRDARPNSELVSRVRPDTRSGEVL